MYLIVRCMTKREWYDVIPRYLGRALAPKCHYIKKQNKPEQNTKKTLAKQEPKISAFYFYDIFQAFGLKYLTSVLFYIPLQKRKKTKKCIYIPAKKWIDLTMRMTSYTRV